MVSKIQSVELQVSANVVMKGEAVVLTANLSDLELEQIAAQGGRIRFMLDGDPDPIPASETDPRTATWEADVEYAGEYRITVVLELDGKERTIGQARIHVVTRMPPLKLDLPESVEEGTVLDLSVIGGPQPPQADPAGGQASLRVGYGQTGRHPAAGGREIAHCSPLGHEQREPRRAQCHGPAGRRARPYRRQRERPDDGDRPDTREAIGAEQERRAARRPAASDLGADARPGVLDADPKLHRADQLRPVCRLHRARARPRRREASSATGR